MPRGAYGIEMRMGKLPIDESVSYAPPRVHFYVGDFGLVENATVTVMAMLPRFRELRT